MSGIAVFSTTVGQVTKSVGTELNKTNKISKYGAVWKIATDMPGWEPGHRDVTIKICRHGTAKGLKLQRGRLGFVASTGKPLSQMRIAVLGKV